jgi:RNA recognition motif-containing protein
MANMRTGASITPEMMAANRAPFVYAQQLAAQQVFNLTQAARHAQGPMYVSSSTGTHVNVSQGAIKTEVRGIFVSNVDYKASSKDLQRYFGRAGEIVKCQLQKDPATGKSKGNATVQYAVAKDAQNAVRMFNSEKYMGMRLKVRLDKEPVAIGMPSAGSGSSGTNGSSAGNSRTVQQSRNNAEPVIVNSSTCQS